MAVAMGSRTLFQPLSAAALASASSSSTFAGKHISSYPFVSTFSPVSPTTTTSRPHSTIVRAQRPTWLPGLDPPPHLDGTLAGDYGFDPLGLGEDPESLRWYVQAELVHARLAMAGVAGILFTDLLRVTKISNLPVWYEAGAVKFNFASTETLFIVQLLLMGYPGGPLLNPLGLAKDIKNAHDWKLKEIKNGRLAMVAMLGIFIQANVTHVGPIDNLMEHLSDPWHRTVIQTMCGAGS
ncbi:photosystem I chlorophyll a/b-binding protein 5, chloroplastic isoform X2 [Telopea speciosissima]|uniref:photosystem I chlorophyll a/b-binding protein 5, chloroplastic isoform X2 n=1 Tax=Telopea speciosissima TaxID=54955 RepID=UPI001CC7693D|nr:photosystem I chlorophyll a/b-binding protein 5, chloroplastic isoform X2 [Telopea speciosissima]